MNPGDRLAHYEIVGPIGKGGMGEVYCALDTVLDRQVAVKILPGDFATDPDRLARFRREAKMLAALNHTNIAAIHGLEEVDGMLGLIMELAPGETLAATIDRGDLPLEDVLKVAIQIANGLEAAHEKSIVHRDLKPANVKLTPDGQVKILDFGLARAYQGEEESAEDPSNSPTMTAAMTQAGVILGTAAYMSPEQARGHGVDSRTDVWAYGVILWELLAGRRLFAGETISDTLAMVLRADPDWSALPADLPPSLRRLLKRCLQRNRRQRLHHIADARIVMEEILLDGTSAHEPVVDSSLPPVIPQRRPALMGWLTATVMAVAVGVLGWLVFSHESPAPAQTVRFDLTLPQETWVSSDRQSVAISPTGDAIVLALESAVGQQLYQRTLDNSAIEPIQGTEGANTPFFSPDGRWIAFTQDGRLRKVSRDGGTAVDLCKTEWGGGVWTTDGRIIFSRSYAGGLDVIPASGGQPESLTEPDMSQGELGHWWAQLLPGEKWLIYTSWSTPIDRARIMALSLESGEQRVLAEGGAFGRYSPSGHLLYVREGQLMAAPFDLKLMATTAAAEPILDDIYLNPTDGYANLEVSKSGTLVYAPASVMESARNLAWVDRSGAMTPLDTPPRQFGPPRISPDGRQIAVPITDNQNRDVWLHDMERGTWSRFTFSPSSDFNPLWSPDGRTVFYNGEEPQFTIYKRPADSSKEPELVLSRPVDSVPTSISPDGKYLVYTSADPVTDSDIWVLPLDGSEAPRPFLLTGFAENMAVVSPDGRWLAYVSNESGRQEIYVMAFPEGGSRIQISIEGGREPAWSPDGDELFFRDRTGYMATAIDTDSSTTLKAGRPDNMFTGHFETSWISRAYSVDAEAQRFLMIHVPVESMPRTVRVVTNWVTELAD